MIDKLEFIIALSRERHFGHAAEACGVSQPTFSAGIKQLEDMLGVLLVERGSRFRGFTPEGERVLDWARRIVGDTRAMRQEIDALKHGLAGHIRIAAIPTALAMVSLITTPYRAQHPDVSFTIWSRNSIEVLGMLENLEIDAGLCECESVYFTLDPDKVKALRREFDARKAAGLPGRWLSAPAKRPHCEPSDRCRCRYTSK